MNFKKLIASGLLTAVIGVIGVSTTASVFANAETTQKGIVAQVVDKIIPSASALTSTGGVISIEQTDLDNVDTSVNNLLKSVFEVLKLLPFVALILGGFYLLDKLFGILPRPGGGGGN